MFLSLDTSLLMGDPTVFLFCVECRPDLTVFLYGNDVRIPISEGGRTRSFFNNDFHRLQPHSADFVKSIPDTKERFAILLDQPLVPF
jgi:hypothetical protein